MKTTSYKIDDRTSGKAHSHPHLGELLNAPDKAPEERHRAKVDPSFHTLLLRQALLRNQVQSAIYELIRGYEATTGFSVIRLDLQSEKRRIVLDAVPAAK
jgi:hypothetical protein